MYKLLLCLRYLRTRYIALASIISVTLGVATMIVVNSVMAGFSDQMRDRIHGMLADVVVETIDLNGTPDPDKQIALVRQTCGDQIEAVTGTVEIYGIMNFQAGKHFLTKPVTLIGIKPDEKAKVSSLTEYLQSYQTLKDGSRFVRGPLRKMSEAPGWSLTEDALAYRQRDQLQRLAEVQVRDRDRAADRNPVGPAPEIDKSLLIDGSGTGIDSETGVQPAGHSETETGVVPPPPEFDLESDAVPELPAGESEPTTSSEPSPAIFDQEGLAEVKEQTDPTAPQDAKVYVGVGLVSYPYEDPKTGEVRRAMFIRPGDDVMLSTVTAAQPPEPARFNATVVDLFESGMSEYDSNLVFCNLEELQRVRGVFDEFEQQGQINSIQIKLKNDEDADEVVQKLRAAFPPSQFRVRTWEDTQGPLLAAVEVEQTILNVLLFLIIAVAGFGILAIFFMIVVEKTRDIGILRALGAGSGGVMSVFLSYGLALGLVGSGAGVVLGLLFVKYINEIERGLSLVTGRKVFDQRIYYFPEIPTLVQPSMVFWVAFGALSIAVLASVIPARRAAALHPVVALRHE